MLNKLQFQLSQGTQNKAKAQNNKDTIYYIPKMLVDHFPKSLNITCQQWELLDAIFLSQTIAGRRVRINFNQALIKGIYMQSLQW